MKLNDCYEKVIDYCNKLGWYERRENDFRQVELMNYAYPVIITITGVAYNEIAIECTTEIRHNFTRFHKETIQKMIINRVINKMPELSTSLEWVTKDNGDILWIIKCQYSDEMELNIFQTDLFRLLLIADTAWSICKRKSKLMNLIDSEGLVIPIANCVEKMRSVYAAIKFLEPFNYSDINKILLGTFLYNLPYRNILRKNGLDVLINYICKQEPELQHYTELWERIRSDWDKLHYSFGKNNIRLIHTFDTYHVLGANICGLNETLELLEYDTSRSKTMLKGKEIGHTPDYKIAIRLPKHRKENIHVAQYWDTWEVNPIFGELENYSLCVFKNESFIMEEILNLRKNFKKNLKWSCETLKEKHLPALCFFEEKPFMLLITKSD